MLGLFSFVFAEAQLATPLQIGTPQLPDKLQWPKGFKTSLDKQLGIFQERPIDAFLHIQSDFDWDDKVEKKDLSSEHRAWFKRIAYELKPKIIAALQNDYDTAINKGIFGQQ